MLLNNRVHWSAKNWGCQWYQWYPWHPMFWHPWKWIGSTIIIYSDNLRNLLHISYVMTEFLKNSDRTHKPWNSGILLPSAPVTKFRPEKLTKESAICALYFIMLHSIFGIFLTFRSKFCQKKQTASEFFQNSIQNFFRSETWMKLQLHMSFMMMKLGNSFSSNLKCVFYNENHNINKGWQ